jgi:hypothetical protein
MESPSYDIPPDDKRFLMIKPVEVSIGDPTTEVTNKINIVLNWFEELKKLAPVP